MKHTNNIINKFYLEHQIGLLTLTLLFFSFPLSTALQSSTKPFKIHVIPHTHDDVGWLQTFDEYFSKDPKCVKCILDNMLISLSNNPKRTFTYVEIAFFKKWYDGIDESKKLEVKSLIKQERLEFANGGWVMNDEATSDYQHIIEQMRLGLEFLKKEFNVIPKVAWSIDPFGHSITHVTFPYLNFSGKINGKIRV